MRQFFSWRLWAALAALIGLVVVLKLVLPADTSESAPVAGPPERRIDFVSLVFLVQPDSKFGIVDGLVTGSADVIIDNRRTMRLVEGTPGSIDCPQYTEIGKCVVVANLLGDAVVWFELVPILPNFKINTAPVVETLDDAMVRLENGWLIRRASTVDRRCKQETGSLQEFINSFGAGSTTIIDVPSQKVTAVVCSDTEAIETLESSTTAAQPTTPAPAPSGGGFAGSTTTTVLR